MQLEGMFDVAPTKRSEVKWDVDIPIDKTPWSIGLIVGPSGSGKSTIARELFGTHLVTGYEWPHDASIVDAFPPSMSIKEITGYLSSVGFSSPPAWLRPFHVLSNGEQFRVTMARAIAEAKVNGDEVIVVDEFTSVVDRTVAQIGSAAIAKAIRRAGLRFIAVTCHYDVADWLEPDWVYEPHTARFARDRLQRPDIKITIRRVHRSAWHLFRHHHYLDTSLNAAALCFVGFIDDQPAVFAAVLAFPHPVRPGWRGHRTVCLPDFQGVGIGNAASNYVASLFRATDKPYRSTTGSPSMIFYRAKSSEWKMTKRPSRNSEGMATSEPSLQKTIAKNRLVAAFEYVGKPNPKAAQAFGLNVAPATHARAEAA
jgi:ABC-type ATPase involved in cell division